MINKSFRELTFTVVDTETTGTYKDDRILEIAAVKILPGYVIDTENVFSELVNPLKKIHYNVYKVHKISSDMVKDKPLMEEIIPSFQTFIENSIIAGHNVSFDLRYIKREFEICGRNFNCPLSVDTLRLSRKFCPELENHKLDSLMNYFNINLNVPDLYRHRALYDVFHTAGILIEFFKIMENQNIYSFSDIQSCIK